MDTQTPAPPPPNRSWTGPQRCSGASIKRRSRVREAAALLPVAPPVRVNSQAAADAADQQHADQRQGPDLAPGPAEKRPPARPIANSAIRPRYRSTTTLFRTGAHSPRVLRQLHHAHRITTETGRQQDIEETADEIPQHQITQRPAHIEVQQQHLPPYGSDNDAEQEQSPSHAPARAGSSGQRALQVAPCHLTHAMRRMTLSQQEER